MLLSMYIKMLGELVSRRVLGQLHSRKTAANPKTNPKSNPNPTRGTIFFRCNCLVVPNPKTIPDLEPKPNPNWATIFLGRAIVWIPLRSSLTILKETLWKTTVKFLKAITMVYYIDWNASVYVLPLKITQTKNNTMK